MSDPKWPNFDHYVLIMTGPGSNHIGILPTFLGCFWVTSIHIVQISTVGPTSQHSPLSDAWQRSQLEFQAGLELQQMINENRCTGSSTSKMSFEDRTEAGLLCRGLLRCNSGLKCACTHALVIVRHMCPAFKESLSTFILLGSHLWKIATWKQNKINHLKYLYFHMNTIWRRYERVCNRK